MAYYIFVGQRKPAYNFKRICVCEKDVNWALSPDRTVNDSDIASMPLKAGKFMKRFYMTDDVIEPAQKKIKCGNVDSGGWEVSLKGFFPGWGDAVMAWIATNGYAFKGCAIFRNCADCKKYLIGEPCNMVHFDDIQSKWCTSVEKEKGHESRLCPSRVNLLQFSPEQLCMTQLLPPGKISRVFIVVHESNPVSKGRVFSFWVDNEIFFCDYYNNYVLFVYFYKL